jgi:hypothetical protein
MAVKFGTKIPIMIERKIENTPLRSRNLMDNNPLSYVLLFASFIDDPLRKIYFLQLEKSRICIFLNLEKLNSGKGQNL